MLQCAITGTSLPSKWCQNLKVLPHAHGTISDISFSGTGMSKLKMQSYIRIDEDAHAPNPSGSLEFFPHILFTKNVMGLI